MLRDREKERLPAGVDFGPPLAQPPHEWLRNSQPGPAGDQGSGSRLMPKRKFSASSSNFQASSRPSQPARRRSRKQGGGKKGKGKGKPPTLPNPEGLVLTSAGETPAVDQEPRRCSCKGPTRATTTTCGLTGNLDQLRAVPVGTSLGKAKVSRGARAVVKTLGGTNAPPKVKVRERV